MTITSSLHVTAISCQPSVLFGQSWRASALKLKSLQDEADRQIAQSLSGIIPLPCLAYAP